MRFRLVVALLLLTVSATAAWCEDSAVDQRSVDSISHPEHLEVKLWADSTQIANPVAFCFDQQGRMYVCETFRQQKGVEDNRGHMDWLDDDLAAQSVEDRLAYFKKFLQEDIDKYTENEERISIVADEDGDGRADRSWVFADGFNDILDGTGAGVLVHGDDVFYTCIPKLWRLRDSDGDGAADQQDALHHGYGVRVAFRGHDLHGLIIGPDGRLYFSIGDRGYNIRTEDGRHLHDAESGAVFRCELDGTKLEVFATGLRNPQELAFDDAGNLFTGENNSDSGDQARWVHLVEGSDSGWRMAFQYLPDRGPWNREKLWHPQHSGQAACIVPPIINLGDGPSGLTYYPGTGLGNEYLGTFFLCDFRGDAAMSGVRSFKLRPRGATFELSEPDRFLWNVLATDIEFGPDGALYATDWIEGWEGVGRGRVVRITNPRQIETARVKNVQRLLARDMSEDSGRALRRRLGNADRRVRMKAQLELSRRGAVTQLAKAARESKQALARRHAVWGLGHIARIEKKKKRRVENVLRPLSRDDDPAIRAATISTLGDLRTRQAADEITAALSESEPQVRYRAAIAVGKLQLAAPPEELLALLADAGDSDPVLRHAGAMGLWGTATPAQLAELASDDRDAVRMAAVLALRRHKSSEIAPFLRDSNPLIVVEAARAIHDVPIQEAMPRLAALIDQPSQDDALLRRVLNANYRLGTQQHAAAVARFMTQPSGSPAMQLEAAQMLAAWDEPSSRDRVLGMWRPLEKRPPVATEVLRGILPHVVKMPAAVAVAAGQLLAKLRIQEAGPILHTMVIDSKYDGTARSDLLRSLATLGYDQFIPALKTALHDSSPKVRSGARDLLAQRDVGAGLEQLRSAVDSKDMWERQSAYKTLASLSDKRCAPILEQAVERLKKGDIPPDTHLDVVDAVQKNSSSDTARKKLQPYLDQLERQPLGRHRLSIHGGDPGRGQRLFFERVSLSCLRCHKVGEDGGQVGPNLAGVGKSQTPEYLLESITDPNKTIAKGFGTLVVLTEDGLQHQGVLRKEMDDLVHLVDADGKRLAIPKDEIILRKQGKSAMPEDLLKRMTPFELRDLVAYLSSLQTPWVEEVDHQHE